MTVRDFSVLEEYGQINGHVFICVNRGNATTELPSSGSHSYLPTFAPTSATLYSRFFELSSCGLMCSVSLAYNGEKFTANSTCVKDGELILPSCNLCLCLTAAPFKRGEAHNFPKL